MAGLALDHVQIAMPAGGESAARHFFGELLGLAEIAKPAELAARGGCWFQTGSLQVHIGVDPDFRVAAKAHVALNTDDLDALRIKLLAAGIGVTDDTPVERRRRFFASDPWGNRIEFVETTAR